MISTINQTLHHNSILWRTICINWTFGAGFSAPEHSRKGSFWGFLTGAPLGDRRHRTHGVRVYVYQTTSSPPPQPQPPPPLVLDALLTTLISVAVLVEECKRLAKLLNGFVGEFDRPARNGETDGTGCVDVTRK
jgi:hypothetical protein